MTEITTLNRDIADGEVYRHTGSLVITGNIGSKAVVEVVEGGLKVKGRVNDGAKIDIKCANSISGNFSSVSGVVTINGVVVSGDVAGSRNQSSKNTGLSSAEFDSGIGSNVSIKCNTSIVINDVAGDALQAKSGNSFTAKNIGVKSVIDAGNSVSLAIVGAGSVIEAGNSARIELLGAGSRLKTGNSANIDVIEHDCAIKAGNSIRAEKSHRSATLKSGNKTKVDHWIDEDSKSAQDAKPQSRINKFFKFKT